MDQASGEPDDHQTSELELGRRTFPDAAAIFSWAPASAEVIKSTCVVVLDTNVLLVPYGVGQKSLAEISRVYRRLVDEGRLVIPGQVAREFARVRAKKLGEMRAVLGDRLSAVQAPPEVGSYPILRDLPEVQNAQDDLEAAREALEKYKHALKRILKRLDSWATTDPVADMYRDLHLDQTVVDPEFDPSDIEEDLAFRHRHKLPPGYKDHGKSNQGMGDLLIWRTILDVGAERNCDLLFVTGDDKADWWHRSAAATVAPRHELIEEFRRASGAKTYQMVSLPSLLNLFEASKEAVDEVSRVSWSGREPQVSNHAIGLPDGLILVVRYEGRYGALQALEQTSSENGASIRYRWWYQPDGSARFVGDLVHQGHGRASEVTSSSPVLQVGPIELQWSVSGDGFGWVYFGPPGGWSPEYELAVTSTQDISEVKIDGLDFLSYARG